MLQKPTMLVAAALTAALAAGPANADGCCACAGGCAPMVEVAPPVTTPFYIVDQGPDYSGPGIVVVPGYVDVDTAPAAYPYVGRNFYFPPYPYVRHHVRLVHHHVHRTHWHAERRRVRVSERSLRHAPR